MNPPAKLTVDRSVPSNPDMPFREPSAVSDNADDFDLEVMDYHRLAYETMRDGRWAKDLRAIEVRD